jgi:hypothetical protein
MIVRGFLTTGSSCEYDADRHQVPTEVEILNGVTCVLRLAGLFRLSVRDSNGANERRDILKRNSRKETHDAKDRRSRKENDERGE